MSLFRTDPFGGAYPSPDISESEREYVIRARFPAVRNDEIQVTFEDGILTVRVPKTMPPRKSVV